MISLFNHRPFLDAFYVKLSIIFPHDSFASSLAKWIPSRSGASAKVPVTVDSRASVMEHPVRLTSYFPMGLFQFTRYQTLNYPVTVYPRLITPGELLEYGTLGQCQTQMQMSQVDSSGEHRGLRPWRPGDAAKNIHWAASARSLVRGHDLRVREYDPPGMFPEQCMVVFHSFSVSGEMVREDSFERAMSLLAGTVKHLWGQGIRVSVQADFLGWHAVRVENRADYYSLLTLLAECKRSKNTEAHEVQAVLDRSSESEPAVVISDMSLKWLEHVNTQEHTVPVDIEQIHFSNKKIRSAKDVKREEAKQSA